MTRYEKLLDVATKENIELFETEFDSELKGMCIGNFIAIKKDMSQSEKACILAEELAHYFTTTGNILDQSNSFNQKQEKQARKMAVNYLITPNDLAIACRNGYTNLFDIADFLSISYEFLLESITVFKSRFGLFYAGDGYDIEFNDIGFTFHEKLSEVI